MNIAALAREVNLAYQTVYRKVSRGMSEPQIRAEAKLRAEAKASGRPLKGIGAALAGTKRSEYIPKVLRVRQEQEAWQKNLRKGDQLAENEIAHSTEDFNAAELRNKIALADQNELKAAQMKRELVPIGEVRAWFGGLVVQARGIIMNIGPELQDRLALDVAGVQLIEHECKRALQVLDEYGQSTLPGKVESNGVKVKRAKKGKL